MFKRKKETPNKPQVADHPLWWRLLAYCFLGLSVAAILLVGLLLYLDMQVLARFSGDDKWRVPGKVYARALELYSGALLNKEMLRDELELLRYERVSQPPSRPGTYRIREDRIDVMTRGFQFWDGQEPQAEAMVVFRGNHVRALQDGHGQSRAIVRLEPALIGGFFPDHHEDRLLITLDDTPRRLLDALLLVEDRGFYSHWGVSLRGMARAFLVNVQQGRVAQGGSTLTQQLVKNYFLHSERTVSRKIKEVLMSVLLELHFSKSELLQAYLNEVYLGQAGSRAIHGFGLASYHYFGRPLASIDVEQLALLVALVKGPSYYDPRRHPERARVRRNQVLEMMAETGLLTGSELKRALVKPLGVLPGTRNAVNLYPAFMDLVRRQLEENYPEEVLSSEGLLIFTTLDPQVQASVEREVTSVVPALAQKSVNKNVKVPLQAAVVVSAPESGEVLAVVGGTEVKAAGFNRALDAKRPVGSIIKPFVYLTALMEADYRLNTVISDDPFFLTQANGELWAPKNFNKQSHGDVLLQEALVNSYNQATARLATEVGMEKVVRVLDVMGLERRVRPLPAVALGALDLSPYEVMQLYQTLSAGGFNTRLRAIRAVVKPDGTLVQNYPFAVKQVVPAPATFEMKHAMRAVVERGTAHSLGSFWANAPIIAGKTGTTDDLRDSWFAGMTGNYLAVVWVGRDDNSPAGLTGSQGALRIWGGMMSHLPIQNLQLNLPEGYEYAWANPFNGAIVEPNCPESVRVAVQMQYISPWPADCLGVTHPEQRRSTKSKRRGLMRLWPWLE